MKFYFSERIPSDEDPGGVTVSKNHPLPTGDFGLTEYIWPDVVLWFVDLDNFTSRELEAARRAFWEAAPMLSVMRDPT